MNVSEKPKHVLVETSEEMILCFQKIFLVGPHDEYERISSP